MNSSLEKPLFLVAGLSSSMPKAEYFFQLDDEIKVQFENLGVFIPAKCPIYKTSSFNVWRLIHVSKSTTMAYKFILSFDKRTKSDLVKVYQDTISGLPPTIWGFDIFTTNTYSLATGQDYYYTATLRDSWSTKQRQKWDFFFRPDIGRLNSKFDSIINVYENNLSLYKRSLKMSIFFNFLIFGLICFLLFSSGLYGAFSWWVASLFYIFILIIIIPVLIFMLVFKRKKRISVNFVNLIINIKSTKRCIDVIKSEKRTIFSQISEVQPPNISLIQKWFKEEILAMEKESKSKFSLADESLLKIDLLRGYAIYQPDFENVLKSVSGEVSTLYGFKTLGNHIVYSGSYIVFIYQTISKIFVTKLYYDFIQQKKIREESLEYHFSDLVGIAINTAVVKDPFGMNEGATHEVNTIWASFTDSCLLEFVILDKEINNELADHLKIDGNDVVEDLSFLEDNGFDFEESLNLNMAQARSIVKHIRESKARVV